MSQSKKKYFVFTSTWDGTQEIKRIEKFKLPNDVKKVTAIRPLLLAQSTHGWDRGFSFTLSVKSMEVYKDEPIYTESYANTGIYHKKEFQRVDFDYGINDYLTLKMYTGLNDISTNNNTTRFKLIFEYDAK